jgi:hypothetical protein
VSIGILLSGDWAQPVKYSQRVEKLEKATGQGVPQCRVVFTDEEAIAAREEIGPKGIILQVCFGTEDD